MNRRLLIKPAARSDLRAAYEHYEQAREGLGDAFREQVGNVLERLVPMPLSYPIVYQNVRRALVRDFPYSIFYLVEDTHCTRHATRCRGRRAAEQERPLHRFECMATSARSGLDHEDWLWLITVSACCLLVAAILIGWSQLRGY